MTRNGLAETAVCRPFACHVIVMSAGLFAPFSAVAGDFIEWTPFQYYVICLGLSLPGLIVAAFILWLVFSRRPLVFLVLVTLWSTLLPIGTGLLIEAGNIDVDDLRIAFLPGLALLPLLAALGWLVPRQWRGKGKDSNAPNSLEDSE